MKELCNAEVMPLSFLVIESLLRLVLVAVASSDGGRYECVTDVAAPAAVDVIVVGELAIDMSYILKHSFSLQPCQKLQYTRTI